MPIGVFDYVWEGLTYSMAVGIPLLFVLVGMIFLSEWINN